MVLNTEWAQVEVIDLINDGSGLAFGIIGGRSTGVVVKTILPGGVADRDGRLQSGDHILQIGEVNLRGLGSEQVASVLRQCGIHVRMVVARPIESTNADYNTLGSHAPIVPTKILGDPVELDKHLIENGLTETFINHSSSLSSPYIFTGKDADFQLHEIASLVDVVKDPLPIGPSPRRSKTSNGSVDILSLSMNLQEPTQPETESYEVNLTKDDSGLGITVAGYVCEKEELSGIFVKSISKGSAADLTNKIKINDRIIEVDGKSVVGRTNHEAVEILRKTGNLVCIKFERYLRGPKYDRLQQAIKANELLAPSSPSSSFPSLPKASLSRMQPNYFIELDPDSRTSFDFDSTIIFESTTPTNEEDKEIIFYESKPAQNFEFIRDKWREILGYDAEIVVAEMRKEPSSGLGISLEGTVDVEDGKEVRPHHYIRNILPDGPVGINRILQSGDELLEVNGIHLLGLNHLEVVKILKKLSHEVKMICARHSTPTRIIDTAQHREAFQARNILAGSLQTLIPSRDRLVKAKSETSLVSCSALSQGLISEGRSRSLEMTAGLPMWRDETTVVELLKGDYGLGFSILDYQDPLSTQETVIVIRSLVPGGVAQADGRLIPGDRLIAVNDINVERANLDTAVQILKGAPRGLVKITVAKPFTSNDGNSQASQDTEDGSTCLEEFQECLEEYQECLEVIHIGVDDDTSFNTSSCTSRSEELEQYNNAQNVTKPKHNNEAINMKRNSIDESDLDISYKSTNNAKCFKFSKHNDEDSISMDHQENRNIFIRGDSQNTQSDKISSEKEGYETCIDESLSEDIKYKHNESRHVNNIYDLVLNEQSPVTGDSDETPTNCRSISMKNSLNDLIETPNVSKILQGLETDLGTGRKANCDLKCYDNYLESNGGDEFFLVDYPSARQKERTVHDDKIDSTEELSENRLGYRKCLKEYYNDIQECMKAFMDKMGTPEMCDDDIFNNIILPVRSRSAPNVMDRSFVMITYDPGPEKCRRRSAFETAHENRIITGFQMTVFRVDSDIKSTAGRVTSNSALHKHWGSTHSVKVFREPNSSLGISIVGGKVDLRAQDNNGNTTLGIFVKSVVQNSPAGKTRKFKTGDRILEVNGVSLDQKSHEEAVQIIRNAKNPVTFVIQSLIPWIENDDSNPSDDPTPIASPVSTNIPVTFSDEFNEDILLNAVNENGSENRRLNDLSIGEESEPPSISVTPEPIQNYQRPATPLPNDETHSSDSEDEDDDSRLLEGRTMSAAGQQIDRASAGNVKRTKEEIANDPEQEDDFGYTTNKVRKKYANLGHSIIMVQLERSSQGLGLSLAGHKDRNCMAVFVCGLNPKGAAFKTGGIQVGDEILEVNGVVLHGRCHLNASAIIKGLSGPIFKVIILRRKAAIDDIAVKPITQFPVSLAEEASEEAFSASYPNVRTVAIKKGAQSLGIMIIEGKHAEVGQGIFISDIQEGSSAEKAGLEIGEMILSVNKDTLVGANYDTAAGLLKRTEGLVTLIVCNPGKKAAMNGPDAAADAQGKGQLKVSGPPSRPATPVPEPPADPATCPINTGVDTTIEIATDNKGLGVVFVGGKDGLIPNGIVLLEILPGGMADKDGRLRVGDQIVDVMGTSMKDATHTVAQLALRQTLPKMRMIVYRPEKVEYTDVEVDYIKKPNKGLGLSIVAMKSGKGVFIGDLVAGGLAEIDGKTMRGDIIVSINGQNVESRTGEDVGAILKTLTGKVSLKLKRLKPTAR
ncbi:inaD-like protein isoform X2 [Coccinella septempunctata]|uniref:inaD-like protein isoform X2 n=1 Tax=Coccinella septempunctata TaxID=41139 RepID=UPI001D064E2E|nr:inaD-like protein isoform X2 [Coccinella septempunctata]